MRTKLIALLLLVTLPSFSCKKEKGKDDPQPPVEEVDVVSPTCWAIVDELGRTDNPKDLRLPRKDKYVALFYWSWHQDGEGGSQCWGQKNINVTEVQKNHPEALSQAEFYDNDPIWGYRGQGIFWGKPLFGYYRTTDEWVLRKHAELLADAGVDVVFFDCSNAAFVWDDSVKAIIKVWSQAREDGVNTPKIGFLLPFVPCDDSLTDLRHLYQWIYGPGLGKDLWFYLDGKPVIMAYPDNLTSAALDSKISNFFNFRPGQPDYVLGPTRDTQWGWLECYPQHVYGKGTDREMCVGVAQNATPGSGGHCYAFNDPTSYGRSYTSKNGYDTSDHAYYKGLNFQEQWDYAHANDPRVVFVSGWNEWIAGRQESWPPTNPYKPFAFPDEFDSEHSRDIEPNAEWGDYGDIYYCQLIRNIRKYKGVVAAPKVTEKKTVNIGSFSGWNEVGPDFKHYPGNVFARNHADHTRSGAVITNNTARNDFVDARVARDDRNVYFYVQTRGRVTYRAEAWMRLFINIDRDYATGWKGYDFCLNYKTPENATSATLSKCTGKDWKWEDAGQVEYAVKDNMMEVKIPREMLGVGEALDFEFKWSDNMQEEGNIMDFYVNGDCAPGARFNFVYTTEN